MRKFLDSVKSTFILLAAVTFAANLALMFWASQRAVVLLCAVLYGACWILFFRADLLLRWKAAVTPLVLATGVLLALWLICAVIGALRLDLLGMVQSIFFAVFLYAASPVVMLLVEMGLPMDTVAMEAVPVFFAALLLLRLVIRATLKARFDK